MDKLIEDYKKELVEDSAYGYPAGLKNKIIKEVESNKFTIPADKVQEMIESARRQNGGTGESNCTIPNASASICVNCDQEKETHSICNDCLTKIINENKQTEL